MNRLLSSIYVKIFFGYVMILTISFSFGYGIFQELQRVERLASGIGPRIEILENFDTLHALTETLQGKVDAYDGKNGRSDIESYLSPILSGTTLLENALGVKIHTVQHIELSVHVRKLTKAIDSLFSKTDPNEIRIAKIEINTILLRFHEGLEVLGSGIKKESLSLIEEQNEISAQAKRRIITLQIITSVIGVFIALLIARTLTSPIEILKETVERVSRGDYGAKVAVHTKGELGALAESFNKMSQALAVHTRGLETAVGERTKELNEKISALHALTVELDESAQMLIRRDVALSRATDRLQELDKMKSEFISVAAHQLRTPLSAIKWVFNLLEEKDSGELTPDQRELVEKGTLSNERMIRLIDDMLTVTRIESGGTMFVMAPTRVGDILLSITQEIKSALSQKGISLTLNKIPEHRSVIADAEKLRYVFQNLLENAMRYTPKGGSILVDLLESTSGIIISIKDSGIGIPKSQQKNIFSKFFRADNAVKTVTDGTGLGLYVAKTIIERLRGTLWFETEEGKGTTFFVKLPYEEAPFVTKAT